MDEIFLKNMMALYKAALYELVVNPDEQDVRQKWLKTISDILKSEKFHFLDRNLMQTVSNEQQEEIERLFEKKRWVQRDILDVSRCYSEYSFGVQFLCKHEVYGCLFVKTPLEEKITERFLKEFTEESNRFFQHYAFVASVSKEDRFYKELFQATKRFHSSMNIECVLNEMVDTLKRVFPHYFYSLNLTIDKNDIELPVYLFEIENTRSMAMEAYVSGEVKVEHLTQANKSVLYVPIKGKQGVYGLLKVDCPPFQLNNERIEFIRLLVETGGSALENAKLYQQSRRFIADLQLINETSRQLNSNLRFSDTILFLQSKILSSFGASACGFIFIEKDGYKVLEGSSPIFLDESGKMYISYVGKRMEEEKDSIFIGDIARKITDRKFPYRSLMAVPMFESDMLKGFCIVLKDSAYGFTFDMYKLLQSLIYHSTLALTNSLLREELERLVITDYLTNLYSRNYLESKMSESLQNDEQGSFLLIDIDDFKKINDTYGHQVGDEVIVQVAKIIQSVSGQKGIAARWGGEELSIYFPHLTVNETEKLSQRIVVEVEEKTNPKVTVSCGMSRWYKGSGEDVESLFKKADQALYVSKATGKNKMTISYHSENDSKMPFS
ncbi:sensor domain-containing diguanylate cyclase [Bacillus smithii]|uniref:Diguanylate cyclase (GGDEF) domain-containing protein n=1 Tax=Bacillus smithii 7_3_47FAA TaxID=665952 RepID=G9QQJ7_9BACI|nr:sensor domain-containing diguanylate cyclase [Bacillus smithii]EHL72778.1 diguanylate cyclase (GGDEF) domain-containing protein [Bacillus smithii 7_3_47FAA]